MSTPNENVTVVTDRDRTPDPVATIKPFRHPWIAGDDTCSECGKPFREHWWVDAGDHGHTVCRLPEHVEEWVPLTREQVALLPDCTPVRVEFEGVSTEGVLHREWTRDDCIYLRCERAFWWAGPLPRSVVHARPEDVPVNPEYDRIERMAKAIHDRDCDCGELCEDDSPEAYRAMARAALAAYREEKA